jgi:hypothetical protein
MARDTTTMLSLAYANPGPPRRRATALRGVPRVRVRVIVGIVVAAIGWLLLGCSGLLWAIAFTADQRSLAIALAVWVLGFVAPSVLATVIAYRLEETAVDSPDEA